MYWGLDYPPLTAFHEYVLGKIAEYLCPEVVTFEASRGCETSSCIVVHILCVFLLAIFSIVRAGYGYTGVSSVLLACDLFCFGLTEITFRFYSILPDGIFSCVAVNRSWPFSVQLGLSGSRSPFALLYRKRLWLHRLFPFCDGHRIQANSTLLFVGVFRVVVAQMLWPEKRFSSFPYRTYSHCFLCSPLSSFLRPSPRGSLASFVSSRGDSANVSVGSMGVRGQSRFCVVHVKQRHQTEPTLHFRANEADVSHRYHLRLSAFALLALEKAFS